MVKEVIKCLVLKAHGVQIPYGKSDILGLVVRLDNKKGTLSIGRHLTTRSNVILNVPCGTLKIGDNVFINDSSKINARDSIEIGDNVIMGQNVLIYDHDHDYKSERFRSTFKTSPVTIGDNTWIGSGVIILKGSRIGKNCIIGAGSIVKCDVPDNSIYFEKREKEIRLIQRDE